MLKFLIHTLWFIKLHEIEEYKIIL